jgi:small subunit ribosomal protein S20
MPLIKSAIKKLRQDRKREIARDEFRKKLQDTLRATKKQPTSAKVQEAYSVIDKAAKMHIMHSNKAARLKSQFAHKIISDKTSKKVTA